MAGITFEDSHHRIPDAGVVYYPAFDATGEAWCAAWTAYLPGEEHLRARVGVGDVAGVNLDLGKAGAVAPPAVGYRGDLSWEVAAPVYRDGRWALERRCIETGGEKGRARVRTLPSPQPSQVEAAGGECGLDSIRIVNDGKGTTYLALSVQGGGQGADGNHVELFGCTDDSCTSLFRSPPELQCYRPSICLRENRPVLAYDAWDGSAYGIRVQDSTGVVGVSRGRGWHIKPDIAVDSEGALWICWIRTQDIESSIGVVDARNLIQLARIESEDGVQAFGGTRDYYTDYEDISHGLLDTDPGPQGVMGYLGRRRHPMLIDTPTGMRLVWEQKKVHDGGTRDNVGVLWAREVGSTTEARAIMSGNLRYELPGSKRSDAEEFLLACFKGVYTDERAVVVGRTDSADLGGGTHSRFAASAWRGWRDIELPRSESPVEERPRIDTAEGTFHLYWFDLHCHTVMSADAEGELDECLRTGRHKALLDGLLLTDNDHYVVPLNRYEWRTTCDVTAGFTDSGNFVAPHGYEWTSRPVIDGKQIVDHRSVILPSPAQDIVRWNEVAGDKGAFYDFVRREGGLVHGHHPDWDLIGDPVEANIEACSSWNPYLEIDPGPYHRELRRGRKIGLIGGSDEHRRNPGLGGALTGIWAESLDTESIIAALKAHRCFATMGRRVILDFRVNDRPIGSCFSAESTHFRIAASSSVPINAVELYCNGDLLREWAPGESSIEIEWRQPTPPDERAYYVKLLLEGELQRDLPSNIQPLLGPRVWSSPIWVKRRNT